MKRAPGQIHPVMLLSDWLNPRRSPDALQSVDLLSTKPRTWEFHSDSVAYMWPHSFIVHRYLSVVVSRLFFAVVQYRKLMSFNLCCDCLQWGESCFSTFCQDFFVSVQLVAYSAFKDKYLSTQINSVYPTLLYYLEMEYKTALPLFKWSTREPYSVICNVNSYLVFHDINYI